MKCDELKAEQWLDYSGEPMPCYPKATVDAAIDELKAEHHKERHEYINMIAEIKQKLEDALDAFKAAFAAGKTSAEEVKKNAKMDELAGTLVDFLKTLKMAVEKEAK